MAKKDLFDEIIECLKMQALVSPDTSVSPEGSRLLHRKVKRRIK